MISLLLSLSVVFTLPAAYSLTLQVTDSLFDARTQRAFKMHPDGVDGSLRIFHPAFLTELVQPIPATTASDLLKLKRDIGSQENFVASMKDITDRGLPWKILPEIGIYDLQNVMSKKDLVEAYASTRHFGHILWAHKIKHIEPGCVLLNHWKQQAILITRYDRQLGAFGISLTTPREQFSWPAMTLEIELKERKWQPVAVSDNILSGEVLNLLPPSMPKAVWELIFLLTLSFKEDKLAFEALIDTGLAPRQGLIAYLRLINTVSIRTQAWNDIPSHRLVVEHDIRD